MTGISVFVAGRSDYLSVLSLSNQYYATQNPILQEQLLATARAIVASVKPTLQTTGFFYIAIAILFFCLVMLKSPQHKKATAIIGIIGFVLVIIGDISLAVIPSLAAVMVGVAGLPVLIWWVMVSVNLLKTAKSIPE